MPKCPDTQFFHDYAAAQKMARECSNGADHFGVIRVIESDIGRADMPISRISNYQVIRGIPDGVLVKNDSLDSIEFLFKRLCFVSSRLLFNTLLRYRLF